MTSRQIEIKKLTSGVGLTAEYNEKTKMLAIKKDETLLGEINEQGFIFEDPTQNLSNEFEDAYESMLDIVDQAKFYIAIYEKADSLPSEKVKDYRIISQYGNTYLGLKDCGELGFQFMICEICKNGKEVKIKETAKNSIDAGKKFATYAGLIDSCEIIELEEAKDIHRCIAYVVSNNQNLTTEQKTRLSDLEYKLAMAYPEIYGNTLTFESEAEIAPKLELQ